MDIIKYLEGRKTYIVAICGGIVFALSCLGIISSDLAVKLYELLGITAIATIRAGINKV